MMKQIIFLLLILILLFSCRKKQPEIVAAQNACDCIEATSADFSIEEATAGFTQSWNRFTETDTIFENRNVRFTAKTEDAEYTWYIGTEVLTSKTFGRHFSSAFLGQNIPVTLVVKKDANTGCFPNDDGYDSITKVFHVAPFIEDTGTDYVFTPMEGTYRMKSAHLPDSFDVDFEMSKDFQATAMFNIQNYDGAGSNCTNTAKLTAGNYRQFFSEQPGNNSGSACKLLSGYIHNQMNGKTVMHFTLYTPNNPNYQVLDYEGRKL